MTDPAINFNHLEREFSIPCWGYRRCKRKAVYIVRFHSLHNCKDRPECDAGGNVIFFMCSACTAATAWQVGKIIGEMYADMPDDAEDGAEIACGSCGHRIMEVNDIFTAENLVGSRKDWGETHPNG
jgi:DNA-directed RNA polymerase subunit RPC12/RpoP